MYMPVFCMGVLRPISIYLGQIDLTAGHEMKNLVV